MTTVCLSTTCAGGDPAHTLSSPRTPQHATMLDTRPRNRPHRRCLSLRLVSLTRALVLTCTPTCTALGRERRTTALGRDFIRPRERSTQHIRGRQTHDMKHDLKHGLEHNQS